MRQSLALSLAAAMAVAAAGTTYAQAESRGQATRAEVEQRTGEMFARMDANDDGVLNDADRAAARREVFDTIDADKDGSISFAEFEARDDYRREARSGRPGADRAEGRGFGRHGGPRGAEGHGLARAADADQDGTVTQAEFTTAALARFDRADANGDGTISAEERRATRMQMHHQRHRDRPARDAG